MTRQNNSSTNSDTESEQMLTPGNSRPLACQRMAC